MGIVVNILETINEIIWKKFEQKSSRSRIVLQLCFRSFLHPRLSGIFFQKIRRREGLAEFPEGQAKQF